MESNQILLARLASLEKENIEIRASASRMEEVKAAGYQENQTIFKTIFESSRLGNKIINSNLTIIKANMALVELLGYSDKNELIGKKIIDYTPEDRRTDWKVLQTKLWRHATPSFSLETCLIKKDGTIIWCQVTSILFSDEGETLGYTIIEDVTERHRLRMQREEFISVASHELKTPITNLKAITQLMNRQLRVGAQITERVFKLGRDSDRQITKLIRLVDDLLSTSSLEQGQLPLNKSVFVLSDIIDSCCSHIQLDDKHHLVLRGDQEIKIFSDEHKIEQVLVNLINNAVKYAPLSKEIVVDVKKIKGFVKISVIDRGAGIPQESIPKLFDRYYRVEQNSFTPGLGLGLFISAEIIRRHGGQIGVESILGKGSNFWFTLPDRVEQEL
jgi:PAS domain S-box-containing protein